MKPKTMMLILVAVGCGLGACSSATKLISKEAPKYQILVALKDIPRGTLLKDEKFVKENFDLSEALEEGKIPESIRRNVVLKPEDLQPLLKDHIFNKKLAKGDPLSTTYLVERTQASLASKLEENYTAFTVLVTAASGVGGHIQPGDYVKVVSTKKMQSDKISKVLMQNIRVVAIDQASEREQQQTGAGAPAPKIPTTVTLEVTDEESKILKLAQEESPLTLGLISLHNVESMLTKRDKKREDLEEKYKGQESEKDKKKKTDELEQFVREQRLGETDLLKPNKPRIEDIIRPGYHAFGVKTSADSTSGGGVLPGNRVDVLGLRKMQTQKGEKKISFVLMKNIRVLTVDDLTTEDKTITNVVSKTVTLEVTDTEAKKLQEVQDEAQLSLAVISKADLAKKTEEELDADRKGEDIEALPEPKKEEIQLVKPKPRRTMQIINSTTGTTVLTENENGYFLPGISNQPSAPPGTQSPAAPPKPNE